MEECVLLQFYLRGGADGLTLCVPVDEPNYHANRFDTRVYHPADVSAPAGKTADIIAPAILSGSTLVRTAFGLPPAFAGMKPLYQANKLCFVHAAGSVDPSRSHFEQQKNTELGEVTATPSKTGLGWLGRYLADTPPVGDGSLRALAFSTYKIVSFNGGNGVTPAYDPEDFDYPGGQALKDQLSALHAAVVNNPLAPGLQNDLGAIQKLSAVNWGTAQGLYPNSVLGNQFRQAFEVIRDVPGIELITIDYDNIAGKRWDTHNDQGVFSGTMASLMADLSATVNAFMYDVDNNLLGKKVIVLIMTEFGRTLHENDGKGTDHGRGGVSMLIGNHVNGGQVYTNPNDPWPTGFSDDLPVQLDIRDLQAEALSKCLGANIANVFPDTSYSYVDHGLINIV